MLSFTKRVDYGLLLLQSLATDKTSTFKSITQITRDYHLPYKFVSAIALKLKSGGLIESREGLRGGYRLAKPTSAVRIGDVYDLLEGIPAGDSCLGGRSCSVSGHCPNRTVMEKISQTIPQSLNHYSLSDLIA